MFELVKQLFDTLMGIELPSAVVLIVSLAIVAALVGKLLDIMTIKGDLWNYAVKISIAFVALSALGGLQWTLSLS